MFHTGPIHGLGLGYVASVTVGLYMMLEYCVMTVVVVGHVGVMVTTEGV